MDVKKVKTVLEYCNQAYDWLNRNHRDDIPKFRTQARTYPSLIAKEGLVVPLLGLLKDALTGSDRDRAEKAYVWVVVKTLFDVVLEKDDHNEYASIDDRGGLQINTVEVIKWIINEFGGYEANLRNEYYTEVLVDYLNVVKKFAEAMIQAEEG